MIAAAFPRLQFIPWVILALGLALTFFFQDAARQTAQRNLRAEFDFRANELVDNIEQRMSRYEQVLEGAAGLFDASSAVDREEFAEYVRALKIESKYAGIQGVGFSQVVLPRDLAAHVRQVRAQGFPAYAIRPPGQRDVYTSIIYLEPFNWRNQRAFGYDMYAEPVRRAAMAAARDGQVTTISGKVRLVQETDEDVQAGFLMYVPIYRHNRPQQTPADRRASHLGWVYAPFRMNDLMAGILGRHFGEVSAQLHLTIHDGASDDDEALLFSSGEHVALADAGFSATRTMTLFGRQWTVTIHSLPTFHSHHLGEKAKLIAFAGTTGSVLLSLVVWLLVTARARALVIADQMTGELRRSHSELVGVNRALRLLSDCNTVLVHAADEYHLLSEICHLCVERGGYLMAWVGYAENDEGKRVRPVAQSGYEAGYLDQIDITWADSERGQGPTGSAIRNRRTEINQDVLTNPNMALWREAAVERGYRSSIALPMISGDEVIGALTIYSSEPDAFDAEEVKLLEELAGDLAFGIVTLRTHSAHEAAKETMAFLAHFDPLTHLPNRLLLRDRFEQAVINTDGERNTVAMLYLDVDYFQKVNDLLGHEIGDKLLIAIVDRLRRYVPLTDTISRLSADEFVVLLAGVRDSVEVAGVANRLRDAFAEPLAVDTHQLGVSFSIGIALYPDDGDDFDTVLKHADAAVRSAKEAGRNLYRFFTPEMNTDLHAQMRLTSRLPIALRNNEFVLHYQPQIDIVSGRIIGAEALIRWQPPDEDLIPPVRFIPLAEQSGHIVEIGEWVINEACRQAMVWREQGLPSLVVAVNLSALQFERGNVQEMTAAALARSGLPPAFLELELTESILLQDVTKTLATLQSLKALGVSLAIDDFGTGYSSLSYLKQLAADKLKIDQSFVRDMLTDSDGASIVKAIIQLGHTLQLRVIAEGVETDAQLAFLGGSGCDEVQGYLFSCPVTADEFARLLRRGLRRGS